MFRKSKVVKTPIPTVQFDGRFLSWSEDAAPTRVDMSKVEAITNVNYGSGHMPVLVIHGRSYHLPEEMTFEEADRYWAKAQHRNVIGLDFGDEC